MKVYAHESPSRFSFLEPPNHQETIQDYYISQFVRPGLISDAKQRERKIEVRFVFHATDIVSHDVPSALIF